MSLLEETLTAFLADQSALEAYTGTDGARIYPLKIPERNAQQPCMTYALVGLDTDRVIDQRAQRQLRRYAFTVWGPNYLQVKQAAETLVEILDDKAAVMREVDDRIGKTWLVDQQDVYDEAAQLNGVESTYIIKLTGATL